MGNIIEEKIKPGEEKPAPIRKNGFSTKIHDRLSKEGDGSDLIYYGYRHYSPKLGRFISKDPIEEQDARNLYAFADNNPINNGDVLGMYKFKFVGSGWNKTRECYVCDIQKDLVENKIPDIEKQISEWVKKANCLRHKCSYKKPLLNALDELKTIISKTKNGLKGSDEVSAKLFDNPKGPYAGYEKLNLFFVNDRFHFNTNPKFDFFSDKEEATKSLFHEASHREAGTVDNHNDCQKSPQQLEFILDSDKRLFSNCMRPMVIIPHGRKDCGDSRDWPNNDCK